MHGKNLNVLTCAVCNHEMVLNRQAALEIGNTDLTQSLLHNNTNGPRVIQSTGRPGPSMDGDHEHVSKGASKGSKGAQKGHGVKGTKSDGDESGNKRRKNLIIQFCNCLFPIPMK